MGGSILTAHSFGIDSECVTQWFVMADVFFASPPRLPGRLTILDPAHIGKLSETLTASQPWVSSTIPTAIFVLPSTTETSAQPDTDTLTIIADAGFTEYRGECLVDQHNGNGTAFTSFEIFSHCPGNPEEPCRSALQISTDYHFLHSEDFDDSYATAFYIRSLGQQCIVSSNGLTSG